MYSMSLGSNSKYCNYFRIHQAIMDCSFGTQLSNEQFKNMRLCKGIKKDGTLCPKSGTKCICCFTKLGAKQSTSRL